MGRLLGSLKDFSGSDLGGVAIKGALEKAGVRADQVDYVIMGQVLTAGAGQIPARQAAVKAGIPMTVPALTINKVCLSGIDAIALADQLIRAGEFEIVVAGGQESMTNAPHLLEKSREGYKYGNVTMRDHMDFDGLWDAFTDQGDGLLTEAGNTGDLEFTRERAGRVLCPQPPARRASLEGRALRRRGRRGVDPSARATRSSSRPTRASVRTPRPRSLGKLRPAFRKDGTITAGSASQISDGAAAVVVMSKAKAEELGLTWLAEIGAHGVVAGPDSTLQSQPAQAIAQACAKEGITPADLDLVEINEAFAAVGSHPPGSWHRRRQGQRQRGRDRGRAPHRHVGGTHHAPPRPGAQRRGGGVGAAALCGGGGQGDALIVRVPQQ